METAVLGEIYRTLTHRGEHPAIYFWRTGGGVEVDFVADIGNQLVPVDVKTTATPHPRMARGIRSFQRDLGDRCGPGFVIHAGEGRLPLAGGVTAAGFTSL